MLPAPTPAPRTGFFGSPLAHVLGSVVSWLLFSLSLMLLIITFVGVQAIGGFCASGNTAYVIQTQCPDNSWLAVPAVFGGLIAVGIGALVAAGFGVSLTNLAWPILFGGLGALFFAGGGVTGYLLGAMFVIMAAVPLVISLRASAQQVFLGAIDARGERFIEGTNARPIPLNQKFADSDTPVAPTFGNWAASILLWIVSAGAGVFLALLIEGYFVGIPQ